MTCGREAIASQRDSAVKKPRFDRSAWGSLNRPRFWIAGATGLLVLGAFFVFFWNDGRPYEPPKNSFDGSSEALEQTLVVPTLDTPIPENKSAIWCSSFQFAWNHLKTDVTKGEIQLKNAEAVAARLNQAEQSENDLDASDFYAMAGRVRDGIVQKIQTEMEHKFPDVPAPQLAAPADGVVAYGYMRARLKFSTPFFENDEKLAFIDSTGTEIGVKSFGIRKRDDYAYKQLREQVKVLYASEDLLERGEGGEFIIDPCKYSHPYQIVLARINRKPTLAEAIADAHKKVTEYSRKGWPIDLRARDTLLIPGMHWRISHHFKELEGTDKQFQNPTLRGLYLDTALQTIEFRLDRSGAELASESKVFVKPAATYFDFNRSFLIILKKRDAEHPIFVMWVDNSELLDK